MRVRPRKPTKIAKVEVRRGLDGNYYWRGFAKNGEEIVRSSEGYVSEEYALAQVHDLYPLAKVEIIDP